MVVWTRLGGKEGENNRLCLRTGSEVGGRRKELLGARKMAQLLRALVARKEVEGFQAPYKSSQLSVTLVPGDVITFSGTRYTTYGIQMIYAGKYAFTENKNKYKRGDV